jgi:hypothetical protein
VNGTEPDGPSIVELEVVKSVLSHLCSDKRLTNVDLWSSSLYQGRDDALRARHERSNQFAQLGELSNRQVGNDMKSTVAADFVQRNSRRVKWPTRLNILERCNCIVVDSGPCGIAEMLRESPNPVRNACGRYCVQLSRPGISESGKVAIIEAHIWKGQETWNSTLYLLHKINGDWTVVGDELIAFW